ncbi:hypothetical protein [Piscirickettsia litoralis]|uniref:Uncharacterized protein n=1 Tax=Piscirickettsia litoralis TaxID=1891921 RepID=A0ABX3AB06_9GAMM|nr:hypothetical protein [Piscirickettsia litoralis]ODN43319.1 hypothetical protein BGC07_10785 [Piscirickettsia litoralis]
MIKQFREQTKPITDKLKLLDYKWSDLSCLESINILNLKNISEDSISLAEQNLIMKRPKRRDGISFLHDIGVFDGMVKDCSLSEKEKRY